MSKNQFFHISKSGVLTSIDHIDEALNKLGDNGFVWISFNSPSKEELSQLIEPLGIHPLSLEDCLDEDQIPKINEFPRNTYLLFNTFNYAGEELAVDEVNFFIGNGFLVTVSRQSENIPHPMNDIEILFKRRNDLVKKGPSYALYVILDHIVDHMMPTIELVEEEIICLEDTLLSRPADFEPVKLQQLRRDLLSLRRSLFHEREILSKICRGEICIILSKAIIHYTDIYDHLVKFLELSETNREVLSSLVQINLSQQSMQMTEASNRTNNSVRRLTFITTIFMPLTLLAGIGGMSEWTMMTGPENWKIAYPIFLLAVAVIGTISYFVIKWLGKRD